MAAVLNHCVIVDSKLAIREQLLTAILAQLHWSHSVQAAILDAWEYFGALS